MVSSKGNVETRIAALGRGTSRLGTLCGVFAMLVLATGCDPCLNNPCDDGVFCNGVEACTADGSAFTCADGTAVVCDDATFACDEDANACTDPCEGVDVDDMNPCTTDTCVDGVAVNVDEGCDDGDACTENDACDPDSVDGTCAGTAIDCGDGKQCDAADGMCVGNDCTTDADCDDMSACTTDTCDGTNCVFTAVDCDDTVNCTIDSCDPTTGCMNSAVVCPAGETCDETDGSCGSVVCAIDADCPDDGLFCNGTESCDTTALTCSSSGDPCTASSTVCNEATDACDANMLTSETIQLTTGTDSLTGADMTNTTFDGQLQIVGGVFFMTINSADVLDGGTGNNVLNIQANSATLISPSSLKNIQVVTIEARGAAANLNAVNADSITTINNTNSTNNTTVTGVQTAPTTFGSTNTAATVLSVTCTDAALAGTTDAATFNVNGVTGGTHVFQPTTAVSGYETITVNSMGGVANVLAGLSDGNGNSLATVNVTGDQNLTITAALANTVVTVNAAGAGGKVAVGMGTGITTSTGGAADDTFTFAGTNYVRASDTVDGGANTTTSPGDTLVAQSGQLTGTTAAVTLVSNIETIGVSNALAGALNLTHFGAANVNLAGTDGTARTVTMATGGVVKLSAATGNSVTFAASPNTNADALTVELSANFAAGDNLVATTFENLTIEAKAAARTINGTTALANSANAEAIKVIGSQNLTFVGVVTADSIDASALTGTALLTITAPMAGASVITGGPGNDVLTESTGNDIVDGGGGNDAISIRAGNDSVTGGTGNDNIIFVDASNDTVNDSGSNTLADFSFGATSDTLTFDVSGLGTLGGGVANPVAAANYFEGAITGMTAGTAYSVIVITNVGYASANTFETALAAQSTAITDALVVFFNTTTSRAELYVDSNIGANGPEIAAADLIVTFSNVTTLAGMTQFANTDFIFGA